MCQQGPDSELPGGGSLATLVWWENWEESGRNSKSGDSFKQNEYDGPEIKEYKIEVKKAVHFFFTRINQSSLDFSITSISRE